MFLGISSLWSSSFGGTGAPAWSACLPAGRPAGVVVADDGSFDPEGFGFTGARGLGLVIPAGGMGAAVVAVDMTVVVGVDVDTTAAVELIPAGGAFRRSLDRPGPNRQKRKPKRSKRATTTRTMRSLRLTLV